MSLKQLVSPTFLAVITGIALAAPLVAQQQATAPAPARAAYNPPRTPWGDPDLQGIWPSTHMVNVPLERPEKYGTRQSLTDAEFKELQQTIAREGELALKDFDAANLAEVQALGDFGDGTSPRPTGSKRAKPRGRRRSSCSRPTDGCRR